MPLFAHCRSLKKPKRSIVFLIILIFGCFSFQGNTEENCWIRINLLGYKPSSPKIAVWCSKADEKINSFQVVDAITAKVAFAGNAGEPFGAYGPFVQTYRLDFSSISKAGTYFLRAGSIHSPQFIIGDDVYKGAADFCLRYMRQQRSGFNPYLNDSCHTHDGYTMYGPVPDSTFIDVSGGWHDASDYLQYSTTSANAAYHLLAAYRDFPGVFSDKYKANGLAGSNGLADVLDEAKWGLDWLIKMHPQPDWMFNQLGDDRDHKGMRIPKEDTNFYGKGLERPVYFCTGEPQGLGKYKNRATGLASTAGKFSSAFSLGYSVFSEVNKNFASLLYEKSQSAYALGINKPGVCQTAPNRAPYFYEEDNWVDDMELAAVNLFMARRKFQHADNGRSKRSSDNSYLAFREDAYEFARQEPVTPWLGADTARHYQWYPFVNLGHYELSKELTGDRQEEIIGYYRAGIDNVWKKAKQNAFYRGIPFIWCSNNLTTSFAIQCYWYRQLSHNNAYLELEQANFDWLFGCNPWGTSFIYGLPLEGDTPIDPHSAFTHLKNYPIDGGLVDGPVYGNIYDKLIGITLYHPDEYAALQSQLVVYHDDYGDYSTNEPTMDGTASLVYLLAAREHETLKQVKKKPLIYSHGAIIRGDTTKRNIALVFTGDEFADGGEYIAKALDSANVKASFFFTGRFYRNPLFRPIIQKLKNAHHYLGPHSDEHLLYCDWAKRDSLFITETAFKKDLAQNYQAMRSFGITNSDARFFLPPYEWYNDTISAWTRTLRLQLINYSPGTRSNADYTYQEMGKSYKDNDEIFKSITDFEMSSVSGLNGFILLIHLGSDPRRKEKFYVKLPLLIKKLKASGYGFLRINELLK